MSLVKRIYIFFFDGSEEAASVKKKIERHPAAEMISFISIEAHTRNLQALKELREASLEPERSSKGELKPCFLVREERVALYPIADVDTVLMLASKR